MDKRVFLKPRGGGVLPYMGYIGMCGPKGYGFFSRFWSEIGYGLCTLVLEFRRSFLFIIRR